MLTYLKSPEEILFHVLRDVKLNGELFSSFAPAPHTNFVQSLTLENPKSLKTANISPVSWLKENNQSNLKMNGYFVDTGLNYSLTLTTSLNGVITPPLAPGRCIRGITFSNVSVKEVTRHRVVLNHEPVSVAHAYPFSTGSEVTIQLGSNPHDKSAYGYSTGSVYPIYQDSEFLICAGYFSRSVMVLWFTI